MATETQAKRAGYRIVRGSYQDTTDDRSDRWYVEHESAQVVDRRGAGYATRREALDAIGDRLRHANPS